MPHPRNSNRSEKLFPSGACGAKPQCQKDTSSIIVPVGDPPTYALCVTLLSSNGTDRFFSGRIDLCEVHISRTGDRNSDAIVMV